MKLFFIGLLALLFFVGTGCESDEKCCKYGHDNTGTCGPCAEKFAQE